MSRRILLALALACLGLAGCEKRLKPGDAIPKLSRDDLRRFREGKGVFERVFVPQTGLGPLFNSASCSECHEDPVSGGRGDEVELHATALRPDGFCDPLVEEGGPVIQQHATPALTAALGISAEPFPKDATGRGERSTPALFGRGLLDAVPDSVILGYADPDDRDHDGISGRPNRALDGRLGRFGRKAFVPTLLDFNQGAFVVEQGVTDPAVPDEESIGGRPLPPGIDPAPDPEIDQASTELASDFVRFLAPPSPARATKASRAGGKLFEQIGCAACHVPTLRTGDSPVAALRRVTFYAYTDLLLHDMGPEGADICLGLASPSEFRTEPLIGLRFAKHFLHGGRAGTVEEAIGAHGGEGSASRERFRKLSDHDRARLIAFLKTL